MTPFLTQTKTFTVRHDLPLDQIIFVIEGSDPIFPGDILKSRTTAENIRILWSQKFGNGYKVVANRLFLDKAGYDPRVQRWRFAFDIWDHEERIIARRGQFAPSRHPVPANSELILIGSSRAEKGSVTK
jgi:hypothetical protein